MPKRVGRGSKFEVTLYYKILQPVGGAWQVLMHFDGSAGRAGNGDHYPIDERCQTSTWQPGDYIVDRFTVQGRRPRVPARGPTRCGPGSSREAIRTGGTCPSPKRPPDMRDTADRVKITTITARLITAIDGASKAAV